MDSSRPTRVLISLTYYRPHISGIVVYAENLAQRLAASGFDVTVLAARHRLPTQESQLPLEEWQDRVRVVRVPVSLQIGRGPIMAGFPVRVASLVRWSDVVNCHLPQFEAILPVLTARSTGKSVILTHHTDLSGWSGIRERISEGALTLTQEVAARFADEIVTYTEDYAAHSKFLQRAKKRGKRITCLIPPVAAHPIDASVRARLTRMIGPSRHTIGFAGRIARQKGLPYLLQAMRIVAARLEGCVLALAGPHQEVIGESHVEQLRRSELSGDVPAVFLGPLETAEMASFYDLLDVLVLPSADTLESFGLVQVEAMHRGCPVVATNLPGVRVPILTSGMGETVPPADPAALADAIVRVVLNRQKYVQPAASIMRLFDPEPTYEHYAEAFENARRHRSGVRTAG